MFLDGCLLREWDSDFDKKRLSVNGSKHVAKNVLEWKMDHWWKMVPKRCSCVVSMVVCWVALVHGNV